MIRPFAEADWPLVGELFRSVLADGLTYAGDPSMSEADLRAYWLSDEHTVVAEEDGVFLGSAHMGPNRPFNGSHIGTASFIVSPHARGRGVGRALGEYVVAWHRTRGFRGIQFNAVVSTNTAAVRLWESLGFDIVGTVPGAFQLPSGEYADLHVMFLNLS